MSLPLSPITNSDSKDPPDKPTLRHGPSMQRQSSISDSGTNNTISSQEQPPISPPARPLFTPFFTLINDVGTSTIHHPTNIHYLFSDDDPSLLTAACLAVLQPPSPSSSSRTNIRLQPPTTSDTANPSTSSSTTSTTGTSKSSSTQQLHMPRQPHNGHDSRVLILDVATSGTEIVRAHSLSPAWQILSTSLAPAPTWAESSSETAINLAASSGDASGAAALSGGYMLRIVGTQVPSNGDWNVNGDRNGDSKVEGEEDGGGESEMGMPDRKFAVLMKEFDTRMKILRTIVAAGEEKRDGADADQGEAGGGEVEAEGDIEKERDSREHM